MKNYQPQLQHASLRIKSIEQALLDENLILLITSTPSYSSMLKNRFTSMNIQCITGANHHEYQGILKSLRHDEIDILILGVEQLINPTKLDTVLAIIKQRVGYVMVDHIHHLSLFNHDIRAEYFTLGKLFETLKHIPWYLFSFAMSTQDKQVMRDLFSSVNDCIPISVPSVSYYPINKLQQLQLLVDYAQQSSVLIVAHDYNQAEMTAYKLNQLVPSGVIHRKVEETSKVALTKRWQEGSLTSLVTTSDTLLPYPYPEVDTILWIQTPLSLTQIAEWEDRFQAKHSIVVGTIETNSYCKATSHNFPFDEQLTNVMNIIAKHPSGITMREMEHFLNIESYTLEKILKGLRAFQATKKVQSRYVVDKPWSLDANYSKTIKQSYQHEHLILNNSLIKNQVNKSIHVRENIMHVYTHIPLPLRPKVLFPIGFFPKSLIYGPWLSKTGFVFECAYQDIESRGNDVIGLIHAQSINSGALSVVSLSRKNDSIDQLAHYINKRLTLPYSRAFEDFDSSVLAENLNPYHKMKAITNQLYVRDEIQLKATTLVLADHADHHWQMAVAAYELLSRNMTKQVVVIFNQP